MREQDSSNEILEAMQKEKVFGKDSKEAKVAWDIVEEIDANRSHHMARYVFEYMGSVKNMYSARTIWSIPFLNRCTWIPLWNNHFLVFFRDSRSNTSTNEGTSTNELIHQVDFMNHIHDLSTMLTYVWKPMAPKTMSLLETLSKICSNQLKTTKIGSMSEKLANAVAEAKIEMDLHGADDRKTKEALKKAVEVSKLSHQGNKVGCTHHEYKSVLDKNALEDAINSMKKIEHFMNLVVIENERLEKNNN